MQTEKGISTEILLEKVIIRARTRNYESLVNSQRIRQRQRRRRRGEGRAFSQAWDIGFSAVGRKSRYPNIKVA